VCRRYTAVDAKLRAHLYTWGDGRLTLEQEFCPVRVQPMELPAIECMLVLPTVIEHTIDERSPLFGLDYDALVQRDAEVIVTYEGTSDFGALMIWSTT
jgi:Inward rectifier potassium channel C-terminal domain